MTTSKVKVEPATPQPGWINQKDMAISCGVSVRTLRNWDLEPVAKIGRDTFYTVGDVIENRLAAHQQKQGKYGKSDDAEFGLESIIDPVERLKAERMQEEIIQLRLRNAVLEGRSLPAWAVTEVLSRILSVAVGVFETLPLDIKRRYPDLDSSIITMLEERIAKTRNEAATVAQQLQDILDDVISEAEERVR